MPPTTEEIVAAQYAGAKAALRPTYEQVLACVLSLGDDVRIEPQQSYVAFARARQFALIQPSTRTRVDLGLVLPDVVPSERLAASTNFGSGSINRRVALTTPADVDAEVEGWLLQAYLHSKLIACGVENPGKLNSPPPTLLDGNGEYFADHGVI